MWDTVARLSGFLRLFEHTGAKLLIVKFSESPADDHNNRGVTAVRNVTKQFKRGTAERRKEEKKVSTFL